MPPPLDLAGRIFGRLTVVERAGRVKFGSWQPAWLCRCDCGAEIVVPQGRLPHRDTIPQGHVIDACLACRGRPCKVCGANIPLAGGGHGRRVTCSAACEEVHRKRQGRENWHARIARDPSLTARMNSRRLERAAADPEYARRLREWEERRQQRRCERKRTDPEYAARLRAAARATYARHAERIQAERRARLDSLSPEERDEWCRRARRYARDWRRKHLAELKADPDAHRKFLDVVNECKRQRYALKSGPPPIRTCAICGAQFESRKYRVLCGDAACALAYGRANQVAHRGRNLFREIERELQRRLHDSDTG